MKKITAFSIYLAIALIFCGLASSCSSNEPENQGDNVTEVKLNKFCDGIYFGDFWKEGYADYYFILASGEIGTTGDTNDILPLNPGDYVVLCDIWGAISDDHNNPIVPEGVYTPHNGRANGTFNTELTFAVYNKEKVGDKYQFVNKLFKDGTITVKHIDGGYNIVAEITTQDGEKMEFTYTGAMKLSDKSDDENDNGHINANLNINTTKVTMQKFAEAESYDNYVLRLFDTDKITNDGLYPDGAGHKLQIDLYTAKGGDIAGEYTPGERMKYTPGTFYPGLWFGQQALGTFCMQSDASYNSKFCTIADGKVTITKNQNDTYTIVCDFKDSDGYAVKTSWTGAIDEFSTKQAPQTTLTSDVTMTPTQCSAAYYYGDYYANGTANYGIFLANDTEVLSIDFVAPKGTADALPVGTYTVSGDNNGWTVSPGEFGYGTAEKTCYIKYAASGSDIVASQKAPIASGTLRISYKNGEYTIEFDFADDYNRYDKQLQAHKISGKWTGAVNIVDYTTSTDRSPRKVMKYNSVKKFQYNQNL